MPSHLPEGKRTSADSLASQRPSEPSVPPPAIPEYELVRRIGSGSYGEVWLARSIMGSWRAVKFVRRATFANDRPYEREFAGIQKFEPISRTHEHVVDLLHVGRNEAAGFFYYVMELADDADGVSEKVSECVSEKSLLSSSHSLTHPLTHSPERYTPHTLKLDLYRRTRLPVDECLTLGLALSSALAHLHGHGLVHRDIKPSNIIYTNGVPKLADLGLVAALDDARSYVGTEGFIPPEGPGTVQADLYSFGKVLYEATTGKDRHDFPEPLTSVGELPEQDRLLELNAVIHRACHPDPRQRYQTADEMHADLALLKSGKSVRRLHKVEHRLAVATRAGVALAAVALIAAGAYFGAIRQAQRAQRAEQEKERQLYAADLTLAQHLWEKGQVGRVQELLEAHRPGAADREDLRGFEWFYLWRLCRQDARRTFTGYPGSIDSLAVSPDGRMLAAAGPHKTVSVWDADSGEVLATIAGHNDVEMTGSGAQDVAFSPNSRTLAFASDDGAIVLWDVASRRERMRVSGLGVQPRSLAFSQDGSTLAFGGVATNTVTLLDVASAQVRARLSGKEGDMVLCVAVSPDGKYLTAGYRDNAVVVWELESRRQCATLSSLLGFVWSVAFSPDGRTLASAGNGPDVVLWDFAATNIVATLSGHENEVETVAFSPDGRTMATDSADTVKLWDTGSRTVRATLRGHRGGVAAVAFSADGQSVFSAGRDGTLKLWNAAAKDDRDVLKGHTHWARSVAFSRDGRTLFSCSRDKTIRLWDVLSGQEIDTLTGHQRPVYRLALSPDGRTLASVSGLITETNGLGEIKLWDAIHRKEIATLAIQNNPICSVAFSPDSALLCTGDGNGTVRLWSVARHEPLDALAAHQSRVNTLAFSPNGKLLVSGGSDGWVKGYSVATRREQFRFQAGSAGIYGGVWSLAFSGDGKTIFSGDADGAIKLWDAASRQLQASLDGTAGVVYSLAFSPDGKTLAAGAHDGTVTLWHLASRRAVATFKEHQAIVEGVAFSPDGTILASASSDKTVRLWRAARHADADAKTQAK